MSNTVGPKRYEEYVYILDFTPRGKSQVIKGRDGPIAQAVGEDRLTLLELLTVPGDAFEVGERVCIGKEGRSKVFSVLGRLSHEELTSAARNELTNVLEKLIIANESRFISYFNELQSLTPRLHALELIPGIGKTFMRQILEERERRPFTGFEDLQNRVGLREPVKLLAKRIVEEILGGSRVNLFVKSPRPPAPAR